MMTQKSGSRTENRFVLRGVEGEARMGEIEINYEELAKAHGIAKSIMPTFNHDRLFFTPAFFLPTDQKYYAQNQTFQRFQFKEKIERNLQLHADKKPNKHPDTLNRAAPNANYCQICQTKYDNYFIHTSQHSHLQTAKNNPINLHIQQICTSFYKHTRNQLPQFKSKGIKKALRSHKQESYRGKSISKDESIQEGSECLPKSVNHSTAVREKQQASNN